MHILSHGDSGTLQLGSSEISTETLWQSAQSLTGWSGSFVDGADILVYGCDLLLTDSGGIQEETTYLGINCLTLREETERPVTVQEGTNKVIGTDKENIINEINNVLGSKISNEAKIKYWDGETSDRIFQILFG